MLWGSDPFAALTVSRQALRRRVEQVLLNLTLRLRAAYVERGLHDETLVPVVAESAAPLRTAAASLLELQDRPATSPKAALREIAATLDGGRWQATLARLSQARETRALPPGQAGETLLAIAELAAALRERLRALS